MFESGIKARKRGFDPPPEYTSVSVHKEAIKALTAALHKELAADSILRGSSISRAISAQTNITPLRIVRNIPAL